MRANTLSGGNRPARGPGRGRRRVQELMAVSDIVINQRVEGEARTEATVDLTALEQGAGKLDLIDAVALVDPAAGPKTVQPRATAENDDQDERDDEDDDLDDEDEDDLVLSTVGTPSNLIQIGTLSEAGSDVL